MVELFRNLNQCLAMSQSEYNLQKFEIQYFGSKK